MNERIKQLALEAKLRPALLLYYYRTIHGLTDTEQEELEQIEKFAELIVEEACQVLWSEACHVSDLAYEEYHRNSKKIKQHFGVEQ